MTDNIHDAEEAAARRALEAAASIADQRESLVKETDAVIWSALLQAMPLAIRDIDPAQFRSDRSEKP